MSSKDRTLSQCLEVMAEVVRQRIRWGKSYQADDLNRGELLDILVQIHEEVDVDSPDAEVVQGLRNELALANRQVGAAKARATKQGAYTKEVVEKSQVLTIQVADLHIANDTLEDAKTSAYEEATEFEEKLSSALLKIESLELDVDDKDNQISNLETDLATSKDLVESLLKDAEE